jgi:L-alanine-DL-glutamate epimerase-like enolase superfamily enzyme
MRITSVDADVLRAPGGDQSSADFTAEAVVVRVRTDDGLEGLAECDHAPEAVRAFVRGRASSSWSIGVEAPLLGRDPLDLEAIAAELYRGNAVSARRGLGLAVLNAVDVALWDLRAKSRGEPLWRTLYGDDAAPPRAYATLYTGAAPFEESVALLEQMAAAARALGFDAAKVEPLDDCVPEARIEDFVAAARTALPDADLLADFGHRFTTADHAAAWIERLAPYRLHLVETPLWPDDLDEYARLTELSDVPIAASELFESPWEFSALVRLGRVDVVQPWPNRVGVSGTLRVADDARANGRRCILAGWNATTIGDALNVHLAAGLGPGLATEHAPAGVYDGFPLRDVAGPAPVFEAGRFRLPTGPGLGVELDEERYAFHLETAR